MRTNRVACSFETGANLGNQIVDRVFYHPSVDQKEEDAVDKGEYKGPGRQSGVEVYAVERGFLGKKVLKPCTEGEGGEKDKEENSDEA